MNKSINQLFIYGWPIKGLEGFEHVGAFKRNTAHSWTLHPESPQHSWFPLQRPLLVLLPILVSNPLIHTHLGF